MSQKTTKTSSKAAVSKGGGAKSRGNFISRQAKARKAVTEADLLTQQTVTPDDVLALEAATEGAVKHAFLFPLEANWFVE